MTTPMGEQAQPDRILLVDDNPVNLQVLFQTLDDRGYKLLVANDGQMALSIARKAHPALILLDIVMPTLDGYEVCRRLKEDPETRESAIIFLSALDDTQNKVRGLDLGAVDYITKPFQPDEVIARVGTHLTIHRLKQSLTHRNQELQAANQRLKSDLDAAARVQQALLPRLPPAVEGVRLAWEYRPCAELGGDSLNVFKLTERHLGMYVLDVSGHGVPAALLSVAITRSLIPNADHSSLVTEPTGHLNKITIVNPAEVVRRLNVIYQMDSNGMHFFTILYGVLDTFTGQFQFVSAGHPAPIILRSTGAVELVDMPGGGVPIGVLEEWHYQDAVLELRSGDRLYLHSDGLSEERNLTGEIFGASRLGAAIRRCRARALSESVDYLVREADAWRGTKHSRDDVSILAAQMD